MTQTKKHQYSQKPQELIFEQYDKWKRILQRPFFLLLPLILEAGPPLLAPPHKLAVVPLHQWHRKTQVPVCLPPLPITSALLWPDPMLKPLSSKRTKSLHLLLLQANVVTATLQDSPKQYSPTFSRATAQSNLQHIPALDLSHSISTTGTSLPPTASLQLQGEVGHKKNQVSTDYKMLLMQPEFPSAFKLWRCSGICEPHAQSHWAVENLCRRHLHTHECTVSMPFVENIHTYMHTFIHTHTHIYTLTLVIVYYQTTASSSHVRHTGIRKCWVWSC